MFNASAFNPQRPNRSYVLLAFLFYYPQEIRDVYVRPASLRQFYYGFPNNFYSAKVSMIPQADA